MRIIENENIIISSLCADGRDYKSMLCSMCKDESNIHNQ